MIHLKSVFKGIFLCIKIAIDTMKYYSALKRKKVLTHATAWMELEDILSEISQIEKNNPV